MRKICKQCGELKEHEAKGLCKACYNREYRLKNYEKVIALTRKWYLENKEKHIALTRKWQKANPEKVNASNKKYRDKNPEKDKARKKKYRNEHIEKENARGKKWREENPEKARIGKKKWRLENPEKEKIRNKKYRFKNPGKMREYRLIRRGYGAVKKGVADKVITENILKYSVITCEKDKKPCPDNFHIDHIIPVTKGGSNDYSNLQILCAHCNLKKHVKIMDYRQDIKNNQMFLKI